MSARAGIDGVSRWFGIRWDDPFTARFEIREELINAGGMLSGVATYALVDYTMGSALWRETGEDEAIATINIAINYVRTAVSGEAVCVTSVDRRNRSNAVLRSEVRHGDGGPLMATAIGTYSIFPRRRARERGGERGGEEPADQP
jgi:acyl-coenzyme A thioesterase PaaI-like protein